MAFRTRHKLVNGRYCYAVRNNKGQFKDIQSIGRATRSDSRIKAVHKPRKRRQGFLGDY